MTVLIKAENLTVIKNEKQILKDISFEISPGDFLSIIGPSGSGKSTLIKCLIGLENHQGTLVRDEDDISVVFQSLNLFPHLNVKENILYGIQRWSKNQQEERFKELIQVFELSHCQDRSIQSLSGGEKQRVALARSLAKKPKVLFLDEPFSSLDEQIRLGLRPFFKKIFEQEKTSIILVTHDQEDAFYFSDKILILKDGSIQQLGSPKDLIKTPKNSFVANFLRSGHIIDHENQKLYFKNKDLSFTSSMDDSCLWKVNIIEKYYYQGKFHYQAVRENQILSFSSYDDFAINQVIGLKANLEHAHKLNN